jgi:hypothetical protein
MVWLFTPFQGSDPVWALLLLALATTLVFLLVFRFAADPEQIQKAKNRIQAHLLELRLFKDSPRTIFSALGKILVHNGKYLRSASRPLLVMLLPIVLLLVHMDGWFGYRPLRLYEAAVVEVKLAAPDADALKQITLEAPAGITIETPPLRFSEAQEVSWSIRGKNAGTHRLEFRGAGLFASKSVSVSDTAWTRVWPTTVTSGFWNQFWNPGEADLNATGPVKQITLNYPSRSVRLWSWEMHWLLLFFLATCLFGWIASRWMKIVI